MLSKAGAAQTKQGSKRELLTRKLADFSRVMKADICLQRIKETMEHEESEAAR